MWKRCVLATCGSLLACSHGALEAFDAQAQTIVDGLSLTQVLGQMTQLDLSTVMNKRTGELDEAAVRAFAKLGVGSYLNTYWHDDDPALNHTTFGYTATEFRALIERIQRITMEENGGHPMVYGIDSIHGASYVVGAVLFPHQINCGASFNPALVYEMGRVTARDTAAAGIPWIFGPILDIAQNALWARTYETFGEDPYLASVLGAAYIRGLQSSNHTAACMKHFLGYSKTPTGHDRDNVVVSDFDLLNTFLPPFQAAIEAGALSTMENYISLNGKPVIASARIMNELLRSDLAFDGVAVTDWNEMYNLHDFHRVATSRDQAVALSLRETSIDMSMVPLDAQFIDYGLQLVHASPEQEKRLRDSAKRVVKMKLALGLYSNPVPGKDKVARVGNAQDRDVALNLARESIVLLENQDSVLPLAKTASVFLTGSSADNVGYQCGGWTLQWQGHAGNQMFPNGISLRKGLEHVVGTHAFTYFNALQVDGHIAEEALATTLALARTHEYTIAAIGEATYTEKPGDLNDLALPKGHETLIQALAATGTKVIVVLFQGRSRLLGTIPDHAVAILHGLLPCEQGGQAVAEILYGDVNPSGKLPITYPKDPANVAIPYNHLVTTRCAYDTCEMQWDFGAGLSYTQFAYAGLRLEKRIVTAHETLKATVTVTNVGTRTGKETVMLFLIQPFRHVSVPEVKRLRHFSKIELQAGEAKDVSFTLSAADWGVYKPEIGTGLERLVEDGDYVVAVKPETSCNVYANVTNPLCQVFTIDSSHSVR